MRQCDSYLTGLGKRLSKEIRMATENNNLVIARLLGMALLEIEDMKAANDRSGRK